MNRTKSLIQKYPPSEACACDICLGFCRRPGWWTVVEASGALAAGYGGRMMLEISPERNFGVLSPAFKGCEGMFALEEYAANGCSFLKQRRCELHGTRFQPLECRVCHHDCPGIGVKCHADIELDWNTPAGHLVVTRWCRLMRLGDLLDFYGVKLRRWRGF